MQNEKKIIMIISIILVIAICSLFIYNILINDLGVITYGTRKDLYEILKLEKKNKIYCDYYKLDLDQKYKKAITKNLGSTAYLEINCYSNKNKQVATIDIIGNRNLVKINGKLYQEIN